MIRNILLNIKQLYIIENKTMTIHSSTIALYIPRKYISTINISQKIYKNEKKKKEVFYPRHIPYASSLYG